MNHKKTLAALAVVALAPMIALRASADAPPATHEVKMVMVGTAARFEPAQLTIRAGDRVRFINASGGPHNVAFDATQPAVAAAKAALLANMPEQMAELMGKHLMNPNETYTMSFANVPAGTYEYNCTPHLAMGMKGTITIQ